VKLQQHLLPYKEVLLMRADSTLLTLADSSVQKKQRLTCQCKQCTISSHE
jgi:hypothetical protein